MLNLEHSEGELIRIEHAGEVLYLRVKKIGQTRVALAYHDPPRAFQVRRKADEPADWPPPDRR